MSLASLPTVSEQGIVAPRADRPELVARLRSRGLTQKQIGDTIGVSEASVSRQLASASWDAAQALDQHGKSIVIDGVDLSATKAA